MGGKGRRRREKNYIAAHGVKNRRLPPPPVASSIDALPSKLRQIISFTRSNQSGSAEVDNAQRKKGDTGDNGTKVEKKFQPEEKLELNNSDVKRKGRDEVESDSSHEKKKKRRKRKDVEDLRFAAGELAGIGSKRKERKKM